MSLEERTFRSEDGRAWTVSLEGAGIGPGAPPELENAGGMLPTETVRIVFRSGDQELSEEYTGLAAVEDLSDGDLRDWFEAAERGRGL
ncbi:MAG TPA: hypothetical protein VFQ76_09215 [Longimicrobiaceae bacterium]|nr:hypothetical protein [Longimicrobiaceae bacterium]